MVESNSRELIQPCTQLVGGIIHACHRLMREYGHISEENQHLLADVFNLSKAEVSGIISFYHDFKTTPQSQRKLSICNAEACQANGSRQLVRAVEQHINAKIPHTVQEPNVSIDFAYCLGLCPNGPAAKLNNQLFSNVSLDQLIPYL